MQPYQYRPLDSETGELRFATIHPGSFDDPLRVTISHARFQRTEIQRVKAEQAKTQSPKARLDRIRSTLPDGWTVGEAAEGQILYFKPFELERDDSVSWSHPEPERLKESLDEKFDVQQHVPHFEALSYTWGPPHPTEDILVEDESHQLSKISVGQNLITALRYLRRRMSSRTLWIDAICINQTDIAERSHQVGRMVDVYAMASRVVVWLGASAEESLVALDHLKLLGAQVEFVRGGLMLRLPGCSKPEWHKHDYELPFNDEVWESVRCLLARPWFKRLWILQEAQLANPESVVLCGSDEIPWPLLRRAIYCLFLKKSGPSTNMVGQLRNAMDCTQLLSGMSVERLLRMSSFRQCSDLRDKIYGMMSVMPSGFAASIKPDYKLDVAVIYRDVFLTYVQHFKRLDLLQQCQQGGQSWPSWIPFWAKPLNMMNTSDRGYRASGISSAHIRCHDNTHQVLGVRFSTVLTTENVKLRTHPIMQDIADYLSPMSIEKLDASPYSGGGTLLDAYLITFSMAAVQDRYAQPSVYLALQDWKAEVLGRVDRGQSPGKSSRHTALVLNNLATHSVIGLENGYIGLAPRTVCAGDCVSVILGCSTPILLRPTDTGAFQVLGPCYVQGLMDGEAILGPLPSDWTVTRSTRTRACCLNPWKPAAYTAQPSTWSSELLRLNRCIGWKQGRAGR